MNSKYYYILTFLFISSLVKSQTFNLTVNNGYGSGEYIEGDTINIWSEAVYGDSVFINWTGTVGDYLINDNEWHTTLIVPAGNGVHDLELTANYDVIPADTQIDSTRYLLYGKNDGVISDVMKDCFYAVPPSPKGIVILLHGTGGKGENFFGKFDRYNQIKDLVYAGYAVFTLDANERTMGDQNGDAEIRWDFLFAAIANSNNNIDIKNIEALMNTIIADFGFPSDIPCFSLGMSAGAVFSDLCASALGFNASAHVTARGRYATYNREDIAPVIWIMSENDHNASADNEGAYLHHLTMSASQTSEWHLFRRSPLYRERFLRSLTGFSLAQSNSVYQRLSDQGYLDSNDFLTVLDISEIPGTILNGLGLTTQQKLDVRQQLLMVNADHVLHSDFNKNIIRFFDQTLDPLSVMPNKIMREDAVVYPNPFNNSATLQFDNPQHHVHSFILFDINGKVVQKTSNISTDQILVERKNLLSGLYFYMLKSIDGIQSGKLIIE